VGTQNVGPLKSEPYRDGGARGFLGDGQTQKQEKNPRLGIERIALLSGSCRP